MTQKIRMWEVTKNNALAELQTSAIGLEEHLEDWLESDISILDENLLVIGRQVRTDFRGLIDLLCLDPSGNTVVVELKKGRTPREVTSQALDYASWVKDLETKKIKELASEYPKLNCSLNEAFELKFEADLPNMLNLSHRSLIVAEAMDDSTERIVRYLSEMNVPINVATVQHFKDNDGREFLARTFLVEPEIAEIRAQTRSGGQRLPNQAEMQIEADRRRVRELYDEICIQASSFLKPKVMRRFTLAFRNRINGSDLTLFVVDLDQSDESMGLRYRLNGIRTMNHLNISKEELSRLLPAELQEMGPNEIRGVSRNEGLNWVGYKGHFKTLKEVDTLMGGLRSTLTKANS